MSKRSTIGWLVVIGLCPLVGCPDRGASTGDAAGSGAAGRAVGAPGAEPGAASATDEMARSRTLLVLLGTGTPNADPDRHGAATAVVVDGVPYLVDFGPGVVRRAAQARRDRGIEALAVRNLKIAFLTHLHSDHTAGYPDLILTPWVLEREEPLEVYGPPGLAAMTGHILSAYNEDIELRLNGLEPTSSPGWQVNVHEVEPGPVYEDPRVRVTAFRVPHGSWEHAYGYRFETPDRTVVISGDTGPCPDIAEVCDGCDVLVHEVYSQAGWERREPEWQRYHAAFHTSAVQLAGIARRARPGLLVLHHQLLWGSTPEELLAEIRAAGYDGPIAYGHDLDVF